MHLHFGPSGVLCCCGASSGVCAVPPRGAGIDIAPVSLTGTPSLQLDMQDSVEQRLLMWVCS